MSGEADKLIELINEYRSSPQTCEGRQTAPVGPLAPQSALARAASMPDVDALQDALKRAGYAPAQLQSITLSGPGSARRTVRERVTAPVSRLPFSTEPGALRPTTTGDDLISDPVL